MELGADQKHNLHSLCDPSLRAAGSFWAARTHPRAEDSDSYKFWLLRAAEEEFGG